MIMNIEIIIPNLLIELIEEFSRVDRVTTSLEGHPADYTSI